MDIIMNVVNTYSVTVAVFIIAAYVEAGVLEMIKLAMKNWEEKTKATVSVVCAVALTLAFVTMIWIDAELPHPGSVAILPIWYSLFFLLQYMADFKLGMKGLVKVLTAEKTEKPKKEKPAKPKYGRFPLDENGNPIV